jgi:hypothetical protein
VTDTTDAYREWDAAYVLGALSPDERREFERHLNECARCANAVAELAGMPGILGVLSAADAGAASDGGDPLREGEHRAGAVQRLARLVRAERRRTRRLLAAGAVIAAGVLVAAGIALGGSIVASRVDQAAPSPAPSPSSSVPADTLEMTPLASGSLTADLTVTPKKWGTLLAWECRYGDVSWADPTEADPTGPADLPEYALYVTAADGTETAVATWRAAGDRAGGLAAATSIPTDDIRSVEIRTVPGDDALARVTL